MCHLNAKQGEINTQFVCLYPVASLTILPHNSGVTTLHKAPPPLILAFWLASPSCMFTQVRLCDRCIFNTHFRSSASASLQTVCQRFDGGEAPYLETRRERCERICSEEGGEKNLARRNRAGPKMRFTLWTLALQLVFALTFSRNPSVCPETALSVTKSRSMFCLYPWRVAHISVTKCKRLWNYGLRLCHSHHCKECMPINDSLGLDPETTLVKLKACGPNMGHSVISCSLQ